MATPKKPSSRRLPRIEPRWVRIMQALQEVPGPTLDELAARLGKARESLASDLSQMRRAGIPVETVFAYGRSRYRLPSAGPWTPVQTLALQLTMHLDELSEAELTAIVDAIERTRISQRGAQKTPEDHAHAE